MKKLTIIVDDDIYQGLHTTIGKENIDGFISKIARPYIVTNQQQASYLEMSKDEQHEKEASEWCEFDLDDFPDSAPI